jgi:hypothetical protein
MLTVSTNPYVQDKDGADLDLIAKAGDQSAPFTAEIYADVDEAKASDHWPKGALQDHVLAEINQLLITQERNKSASRMRDLPKAIAREIAEKQAELGAIFGGDGSPEDKMTAMTALQAEITALKAELAGLG